VATAGGLMEIYGATIHPTEDSARKTPPRGYLFAGRLWNDRFVGEMARLSGSTIELTSARMPLISRDFEKGSKVVIQRQLPGWDGTAVQTAWIGVVAPTVASIERSLSRQFWALAALLAAIIGILYIFVSLEVSAPLGLLYQGLDSEDPVIAEQLSADRSEFGYIAQLVTKVFEQKTQLLSEIAQLKKTEESLGKDKERLTAQVVELSEEALSLKAALKQTADNREKMDQLTQEVTELRTAEKIFRSAYADMERKLEEANGRIEVVNELLQREILNEHEQRDVALTALAEKEKLEAELAAFKSDMANKDHDLMNEPPIVRPAIIIDKKIKSKKKDVPEITSFQASC
jgi:hypothetical protein